jgi:protein involved in polysaccharide export with SLBB domain
MSAVHREGRDQPVQRTIGRLGSRGRRLSTLLAMACTLMGCAVALGAQPPARAEGDFKVGDRVVLRVVGEAQLTDTFTVSSGPALVLPIVGSVSLAGVSRDGVEKVLTEAIARYYRNPSVHARALLRVAVLGEVVRPGFYALPADMLVPDVVMAAGGPTTTGKVEDMKIMRGDAVLFSTDSTKQAVARGQTLSQLGIRSEDQFVVPRAGDPERTLRIVSTIVTSVIAVFTIIILSRR